MTTRHLPDSVEGYGPIRPFTGVEPAAGAGGDAAATRVHPYASGREKLLRDLDAAFDACGIADGATLSFHHHLRNGDQVLNQVLAVAARRGLQRPAHRGELAVPGACAAGRAHCERRRRRDLDRLRRRAGRRGPVARRCSRRRS